MNKWDLRSIKLFAEYNREKGNYEFNVDNPSFASQTKGILEEGYEPFQILQIETLMIFFYKRKNSKGKNE